MRPKPPKSDAVLDAWIIDEINRREKEKRERLRKEDDQRPRIEIPEYPPEPPKDDDKDKKDNDPVIITYDLGKKPR